MNSKHRAGAREWIARLALAVGGPLVAFTGGELALRGVGYGYDPAFFVPLDDETHTTNERFGWRFFDPSLARVPVPTRLTKTAAGDTRRVFVLGGSAAMGTPDEAYGLSRFLHATLEAAEPERPVEVVNAAMTAINSHVAREIASECAAFDPDVFVVYLGNNEVVGPYGAGTVFTGQVTSRAAIRVGQWARRFRLGQLVLDASRSLRRQGRDGSWAGMEMFLEQTVAADAPGLDRVYDNFRDNLTAIVDAAGDAGASVVLSTVVTNLRDCAPFASIAAPGEAASSAIAAGDVAGAVAADSTHAEARFRLARSLEPSDLDAALSHFRAARDLDALRFRADSRINDIVRDVARAHDHVVLVDAVASFTDAALRDGRAGPGVDVLYEHVHLNARGNAALAREIAAAMGASAADVDYERVAYSRWSDRKQREAIVTMLKRPPFTNQYDHADVVRAWSSVPADSADVHDGLRTVQRARRRYPDDLYLLEKEAELHLELGDVDRALDAFRQLTDRQPRKVDWLERLGHVYERLGDRSRARIVYERLLEVNPFLSPVHLALSRVTDEPVPHLRRSLELDPSCRACRLALAGAEIARGNFDAAEPLLVAAVEAEPRDARSWNNLGTVYMRLGRRADAVNAYERAVDADPTYADARANLERARR